MLSLLGGSTELSSVQQGMELAPQNHMVSFVVCLCSNPAKWCDIQLCFFLFPCFFSLLLWNTRTAIAIRNGHSRWIGFGRRGMLDVSRRKYDMVFARKWR